MTSQTRICNQALSKLGANQIINIDQDSTEAGLCKTFYDDVLREMLESHTWTFATKRYELPKSAETPPKPFAAKFLIPSDVLRVIEASEQPDFTRGNRTDWQVEDGFILSNSDTMYIRAIYNNTAVNSYTPKFIRAFAVRLASELSLAITESRSMHESLVQEFTMLMGAAVGSDSQQGRSRVYRSNQLIDVRSNGTNYAGPYV